MEHRRCIGRKCRGKRGETLVEVLLALLISTLATLVFTGAVGTTMELVRSGREKLRSYNTVNNALELRSSISGVTGFSKKSGRISLGGLGPEADVTFYCNDNGKTPVISYQEG